ncbi:probable helicase senataxin [Trichonephila clavata]|uniref:Probable helicase senataxin n=1 Tax=Trichonephila clavata TaxID=2740835 RepID=A0A8X6HJK0_TRICU|nr:probable helicase senataxin [Trichonephila clavata]
MIQYYLRQIERGNEHPLIIELDKPEIIVGRETSPIPSKYIQVSRKHARFKKQNGDWFVEDLGSLNGVFVNGNEISNSVKLEIGDHIGFGVPGAVADCDGFVCSFVMRTVAEKIIFIDLCDDPPIIKTEPPDDISLPDITEPSHNTNSRDVVPHNKSIQNASNLNNQRNASVINVCASTSSVIGNISNSNSTHKEVVPKNTFDQFSSEKTVCPRPSSSITSSHSTENKTDHINLKDNVNKLNFLNNESSNMKNITRNGKKLQHVIKNVNKDIKQYSVLTDNVHHSISSENVTVSNIIENKPHMQTNTKMQQKKPETCEWNQNYVVNSNEYALPPRKHIKVKECNVCVKRCDDEDFKLPFDVKWLNKRNQEVKTDEQFKIKKKKLSLGTENIEDVSKCFDDEKDNSSLCRNKRFIPDKFSSVKFHDFDSKISDMRVNEQTNPNDMDSVKNDKQGDNDNIINDGYSQTEDIIIIDDDETYFDFNSSQLIIKQEPLDDEMDIDFELDADKKISSNDLPVSNDDSESVDKIKEFLKSIETKNFRNETQVKEQSIEIEDYFPLSQLNNYSDTDEKEDLPNNRIAVIGNLLGTSTRRDIKAMPSSDDSDSSVSSHNSVIIPFQQKEEITEHVDVENEDSRKNKKLPETKGRTKLIEPQKMNRRPKKIRGREEWFDDKASENVPVASVSALRKSKKSVQSPKKKDSPKRKNAKFVQSLKKKDSPKRKNVKSAKQLLLNKIQTPNNDIKKNTGKQSAEISSVIHDKNSVSKIEATKESTPKKKNPPVPRYNKSGSRSEFLTTDIIQAGTAKKKSLSKSKESVPRKIKSGAENRKNAEDPNPNTSTSIVKNKSVIPFVPQHKIGSSTFTSNANKSVPSIAPQHKITNQSLNLKSDNAHQIIQHFTGSKTGKPAASVSPIPNTSFGNKKDSSKLNQRYEGQASDRDPRLHRQLNLVNNYAQIFGNIRSTAYVRGLNQNQGNSVNILNNNSQISSMSSSNIAQFHPMNNDMNTVSRRQGSMMPSNSFSSALHQISMPEPSQQNLSLVDFISTIRLIVELNVKWLEEQSKLDKPPPAVAKGATNLPLYFDSSNHYISSFFPMLMLEIWDLMHQESKPIFENPNRVVNKFYFVVVSCESRHGMTIYKCEALVNEQSFTPTEGNLLIMCIINAETKKCVPCFSYVFWSQINSTKIPTPEWKRVSPKWLENAKLWEFSVYCKTRQTSPILHHVMKGNGICGIRNKVRLADTLRCIQYSPLEKLILKPNYDDFYVSYPDVSPDREYSYSQKMAIKGISTEILKKDSKPKIILLQGPPGTGKTHVIVGLLKKLIQSNPYFKILVTAPSNAAVDEIGCRLRELNHRASYKSVEIKFVRVGLPTQINEHLKSHSLDEKAIKMFRNHSRMMKMREDDLKNIERKIDDLKKMKSNFEIQQKIKKLSEERKSLKKLATQHSSDYVLMNNFKEKILKETHIVLSTLGSSRHSSLTSFFKRNAFSFCIIDEATQCTETEVLIPLMYGIDKLIMVGDHQQLPATVNSKFAVSFGFERSMFERFYLYFSKYCQKQSPIFMLREQFRMHSEISHFPSKHFYDNLLTTAPQIDIQYNDFPVFPYVVYDILDSQESSSSNSKTNSNEALVIVKICSELLRLNSHISIGIITPYQAQCALYSKSLKQNPNYRHIEVNTVDSFQGREKDIIIVSCVRANNGTGGIGFLSCKKRLNVAITRARKCLIICIHSNTLIQDENWKKLIEDAKERGCLKTVASYKDIQYIFASTMIKLRRYR